jgi:hypothetical protein
MIAQMVQDHTSKYFDNAICHRDRIQKELENMHQLLKKIEEAQATSIIIGVGLSTLHT